MATVLLEKNTSVKHCSDFFCAYTCDRAGMPFFDTVPINEPMNIAGPQRDPSSFKKQNDFTMCYKEFCGSRNGEFKWIFDL